MRADEPKSAQEFILFMLFEVRASVDIIVHASQKINYGCVSLRHLTSDCVNVFNQRSILHSGDRRPKISCDVFGVS